MNEVGAGFGVTATVELLAVRTPKLRADLREVKPEVLALAHVTADLTLIQIDRIAAHRAFLLGEHQMHGMNLQKQRHAPYGRLLA